MGNPSGLPSSSLPVNVGILPSYSHKVVAPPPPTTSFPSAYIISFRKSGYPTIIFSQSGRTSTSHPQPKSSLPVWIRIPSLHAHQWTPILSPAVFPTVMIGNLQSHSPNEVPILSAHISIRYPILWAYISTYTMLTFTMSKRCTHPVNLH